MTTNYYFVNQLSGENFNIVDGSGSVLLTLNRCSRRQAEAVRDAMEYTRREGESNAGSFSEGFDHGAAVGMREAEEIAFEAGYAQGRSDYHNELWARGTDVESDEDASLSQVV